jgi:ABC-2 type transport system permease protein
VSRWWTVARRELASAFLSPLAYVLGGVYLLISGYFFVGVLLGSQSTDMQPVLDNIDVLLLFVAPLLTMRLLAEERRLGTDELILTSPVTPAQWVVGKFAGALGVWTAFVLVTVLYPIIAAHLGYLDVMATVGGYVGLWLLGAALLAAGVFASSLTDNQAVAAMVGFGIGLLLWVAGWMSGALSGSLSSFLGYLSAPNQYADFAKGILDTSHLVYFLSLIVGFLFLAVRSVDARRWA